MAAMLGPMTMHGEALQEYVDKKDDAFAYRVVEQVPVMGMQVVKVRLTSQEWRGRKWEHWLTVLVPPMIGEHRSVARFWGPIRRRKQSTLAIKQCNASARWRSSTWV